MSTITTGVYSRTYRQDFLLRRTWLERARLALVLLAIAVAPFLLSVYWLEVATQIAIAAIGAIGLNILVGFTGQISLGQGGFLAVGAFTAGLTAIHTGLNPLAGVALAGVVGAVVGGFFGLPALRLKGLYLAIATLASQVIITWSIIHLSFLGAAEPLAIVEPATVFGWTVSGTWEWFWVIAAFAAVAAVLATNLFRTGVGRAFVAIRDQDIAAEAVGVNVAGYKILAFALSSAFAGVAGALTAYRDTFLTWESFTFEISILYLAMIIVGGLGSVSGAIYGAAFIIGLQAFLQELGGNLQGSFPSVQENLPAIQQIIFGLTIVLFLIFEPRGLARIWQRSKDYLRLWPFRY
ncbi:MAG: branched-chain amino acid ABC transporter permease [Actinobacteria bacterium]|nr:branched-chain amino acid ABC transporter permease [Actinomycetota bacterium]